MRFEDGVSLKGLGLRPGIPKSWNIGTEEDMQRVNHRSRRVQSLYQIGFQIVQNKLSVSYTLHSDIRRK
jgi:hypothetical protein